MEVISKPKTISVLDKKITWLNVKKPGKEEVKYLQDKYNFFALDLKDCLPPLQRPKLVVRENYIFMILNFPIFKHDSKEIKSAEIDFFISKDYLITIHNNNLNDFNKLEKNILTNLKLQNELFANTGNLVYAILEELIESEFPMLNLISLELDKLEKNVLEPDDPKSIKEILIVKRNIANFRKIMLSHKSVIRKLVDNCSPFFPTKNLSKFFNNLVEQTKDIWEALENYKETIDALHQTKESIHSYRLNDIMKTLTIFSVVVFPLTLMAAIFGMNTISGMPFMEMKFGFWGVIGLMATGTICMFIFFKKKKWL